MNAMYVSAMILAILATLAGAIHHPPAAAAAEPMAELPLTVLVGGYQFPPYVEMNRSDGSITGLTIETISALNAQQDRYRFVFVPTTPTRRYQDFTNRRFDIMLFEMTNWGWTDQGIAVDASGTIGADGEVYIAQARQDRDEGWFDTVTDQKIAAILGYHYQFADFQNDPVQLRSRFDIVLVNDSEAVIALVLRGRVMAGVVTRSFLERYLNRHPQDRARILISTRLDQLYDLRVLAHPEATLSAYAVRCLLADLDAADRLAPLWQSHGLEPVPLRQVYLPLVPRASGVPGGACQTGADMLPTRERIRPSPEKSGR
ncbi:hypothetical protein GCM10011505_01880 [Tistrella bauzanensis]|uniref:Solute-binding protein family 3/N-terminal domain-containing protein n=2 Tax=Tistrella bauzanensis TaxID=657419 RepID=A0ABQ1I8L1_9PROT|nr:hypothetical protein GCM10011505_01880 [Tistrella bauzanensis]